MHSLDLVVSFLCTFDFPGHRPCCWKTTTYKHWDSDRHRHTQTGTQRHWDTETQRQGETKTRWHIGIITYRRRQTHGGTSTETHIVIHTQTHRHRNTINPCMLSTHNRAPIHSLSSQETTHTPLLCYCHRLWSYRQPVSATKLSAVTSTWSSLYRPLYGSISPLPLLSYDPYRCYGFSCLNSQVFSEFFFCLQFSVNTDRKCPCCAENQARERKTCNALGDTRIGEMLPFMFVKKITFLSYLQSNVYILIALAILSKEYIDFNLWRCTQYRFSNCLWDDYI